MTETAAPPEVSGSPGVRYLPGIKVNHDAETSHRNIRSAVARGLKPLLPLAFTEQPMAICGGGPSLLENLSRIRKYQRKKGYAVLAVNGAWKPLVEFGIRPDYIAIADAAPRMIGLVDAKQDSTWLVASKCDPAVFDKLQGARIELWHAWDGYGEQELLAELIGEREPWCVVSGGCTVGLRSIDLSWIKGHRAYDLFGFDSCFTWKGKQHAYENVSIYGQTIEVRPHGSERTFLTSPQMARQATDFIGLLNVWGQRYPDATVRVHGDGLIAELARCWNEAVKHGSAVVAR